MADESLIEETGNQPLNSNTVVVTASEIAVGETVNEDILQHAFVGNEDFDQEAVAYSVEADSDDVSRSVAHEIESTVVTDPGLDSATQMVADNSGFGTTTYRVVSALPDGTIALPDDLITQAVSGGTTEHIDESASGEVTLIDPEGQQTLEGQQILLPVGDGQQELQDTAPADSQNVQEEENKPTEEQPQVRQTLRLTLMDTSSQSGAPLGSSQNPIRIIQQGNNYTPMQQLTSEQLQQIMQVVQQQQVAKNTQEAGGSVLFNPNTNTRIVYRVIYPSELHKGQQTVLHVTPKGTTTSSIPIQQTVPLPKRQYRRRGKDDEEDKMDGPEMSKEEKEERKKHRPRTRSGRVSKPPRHMVKDYKHIHVLDWDEDYDDSDGGYSDYKGSDEERSKEKEKRAAPDFYSGLAMSSSRPKNHKCQTCEKCYIGQGGLARHYRLNPSHGSIPEDSLENEEPTNGVSGSAESTPLLMDNGSAAVASTASVTVPTIASSVGSSAGNLSEDSNTQDSIPSSSGAISPITTRTPRRGRGGYRGRGRWAFHHHTAPARRKQKLKEVVRAAEDDDLMEVVLPRLVKFVSLWEFMLMKVETCNGTHPRVDHIYREFLALHKHVKRVCQEGLHAKQDTGQQNGLDGEESKDGNLDILKLEDEAIAKSLGLSSGSYEIKDLPVNEYSSFRYKYLTSDPNGPPGVSAEKRTIQVVTPDELVSQSPSKRSKTTSLLHSTSSTPPSVTLAPSVAAASSLLSSIVTNSGLKGSGSKQPSLFRTVSIQQPQSNLLQTVRVQQPQNSLLQNVAVQQPQTVLPAMTLQPQPPAAAVLRTVSVPAQNQPSTVLRTVTMQSHPQPTQTSLLRSVQQPLVVNANVHTPVVVSAGKHSNGAGLMGVSLLNNHRSAGITQPPSIAVLKTAPGQTSHVLVAASASQTVTGTGLSEIPQSQAAQVVSVLPTSISTTPLSLLHQTPGSMASDFTAMTPDDFMDTSDDSLVSSVSGLSSANSSGLVSVNPSLPNGEMAEVGFSSVVKINGVSDPPRSESVVVEKEQSSLLNDAISVSAVSAMQENTDQLTVSSAMDSVPSTSSLFIKCENGELYTVASTDTDETISLAPPTADSVLAAADVPSTTPIVNGQLGSAQIEDGQLKVEKEESEQQSVILADGSEVIGQDDHLTEGGDGHMDLEESAEGASFTLHRDATLFQTEDGTVILQNPDGTTFQLQGVGEQGLTLESVQELLGQMVSGDHVQTELQQ